MRGVQCARYKGHKTFRLTSCVTLGKAPPLSEPRFPSLLSGDDSSVVRLRLLQSGVGGHSLECGSHGCEGDAGGGWNQGAAEMKLWPLSPVVQGAVGA